ncbi:MAG: bifunctional aspartate kinase/homoserine dehydrogenase I [Prevotella sp.]|nr:bifunctional aspartate kinase/homoserine dehydrogenase I [Prevotella sp.]
MKVLKFGKEATDSQRGASALKHIVNREARAGRLVVVMEHCPYISDATFADAEWMDVHELTRDTVEDLPQISLVVGNDYTAALIAAEIGADVLEIWTNVDGFMTADPKLIPAAYTIPSLSYTEAMELCHFGVRILYPPTIYPVCVKQIPIHVRNMYNVDGQGTIIGSSQATSQPSQTSSLRQIRGISSIEHTALITVTGPSMVGVVGVNRRIFSTLASVGVSAFMVAQASSENSTSIAVLEDQAPKAAEALNETFKGEIETGAINPMIVETALATIGIVGEQMKHSPGIAGKIFSTLGRNGINVIAFAQGARQNNITIVVHSALLMKSLNVLHDSFFLSEYKVLNLFVCGIGTVGGKLLEQIQTQAATLMKRHRLRLNVVGIASSRNAIFSRQGLATDDCRRQLKTSPPSTPKKLLEAIVNMNVYNAVFVDCTASKEIADLYQPLLEHNVSIVAANKIAASSEYGNYRQLKETAIRQGVKFLFETNVGAGLPIIGTINDLRNSGDHIIRIQAVLSGTLNYIFNEISADVPFSETVRRAKEQGYSEPDPRIDLSGKDVVRKLVILTREAGYAIEQSDVERHLFLPDDYFQGTQEEFWQRLPLLDEDFEKRRKALEAEGRRWRFVAQMDEGRAQVSLEAVDRSHPFYNLEGSNNIVLLTTERYRQYPMLIQGYGAGASVTAAGVFANIMSIANI